LEKSIVLGNVFIAIATQSHYVNELFFRKLKYKNDEI